MNQNLNYNEYNEQEEELNTNIKNIILALWNRRFLMVKTFIITLLIFIVLLFILPKQWKVQADLYINKSNNSNLMDINPYAIEEGGNMYGLLGANNSLTNELEIIQSPRVIDKVVRENNLKYEKIFNIIPTRKVGEYWTTEKFLKKDVKFENIKGTNIISISFRCKYPEKSYNIVQSIVKNYIALHKEINNDKSKSDKAIIESEYNKAKTDLSKQLKSTVGIPATSLTGSGNLTAMSAFSRSAQNALANLESKFKEGEQARINVSESAAKVSQLATKLEWANLVEEMSDSSKVILLRSPYPLRAWEYDFPKPFTFIILGIVFGIITAICSAIYKEFFDDKLTYAMLGKNIIYDLKKEYTKFSAALLLSPKEKLSIVMFEEIPDNILDKLRKINNVEFIKAEITPEFGQALANSGNIVLVVSIAKTPAETYKLIKNKISDMNKNIIFEVLV